MSRMGWELGVVSDSGNCDFRGNRALSENRLIPLCPSPQKHSNQNRFYAALVQTGLPTS